MSRFDRVIARRQFVATEFRARGKKYIEKVGEKFEVRQPTKQPWWPSRLADLIERRQPDGTYKPRESQMVTIEPPRITPEMLSRPADMTRQQHRRLFREACTQAGVDYRTAK